MGTEVRPIREGSSKSRGRNAGRVNAADGTRRNRLRYARKPKAGWRVLRTYGI